jgi:phytoene dehydrogenase-like protein
MPASRTDPTPPRRTSAVDVLVVGAGIAGLSAALTAARSGRTVVVLEAAGGPGGRVRTIERDGYRFDAGFQVWFPAYPAISRVLGGVLPPFVRIPSAAVVRDGGPETTVGAPWAGRDVVAGTLDGTVFTPADFVRLARLVTEVVAVPVHATLVGPDESIEAFLRRRGFSERSVRRFFVPFFGGIFLDRALTGSARTFRYYLRMLVVGGAARPLGGIGRLPEAMARTLDVRYDTPVVSLDATSRGVTVHTADGGAVDARHVVVATDPVTATRLAGVPSVHGARGAAYLVFTGPEGIDAERRLIVGDGDPVQDAWWVGNVDATCAPSGRTVLSVTVLEPHASDPPARLEARVRDTLRSWYGRREEELELLDLRRIPFAQVAHPPGFMGLSGSVLTSLPHVTWASDAIDGSSLQGAASAGERAAAAAWGDAAILGRPRGA